MNNSSLNESIIKIRVELQKSKLKKSGKNKFAGFDYYELADFLPKLNELMLEENINDRFYIKDDYATLEIQKDEEIATYTMPFVLFDTPLVYKKDKNGNYVKDKNGDFILGPSMQDIQYLGALNTYYKRYLYLNAFGITDGEVIDALDDSDNVKPIEKKNVKVTLATEKQLAKIKELYTDEEIKKALNCVKKNTIEKLTVYEASSLISKRMKKEEEKTNE